MVEKRTRQGGLSFHFLFNLFYQRMIADLANSVGGININGISYNAFCFADDILLMQYFAMRSVGLCKSGVEPYTMAHIWKTTIQPVLSYSTQSFSQ